MIGGWKDRTVYTQQKKMNNDQIDTASEQLFSYLTFFHSIFFFLSISSSLLASPSVVCLLTYISLPLPPCLLHALRSVCLSRRWNCPLTAHLSASS
jgi:hypothetical protein